MQQVNAIFSPENLLLDEANAPLPLLSLNSTVFSFSKVFAGETPAAMQLAVLDSLPLKKSSPQTLYRKIKDQEFFRQYFRFYSS